MKKVTKAIIPAAGLGTRFLPITKALPKPMLPVLDKPTVQYIMEELKNAGIDDVVIVVSPGSEMIERHFSAAPELEERLISDGKKELYDIARETCSFNVKFVEQKVANGLAGAILCAEKYIGDEPFALLLGDELLIPKEGGKGCISALKDIYEATGKSVIATMEVFGDDVSKYGNIGIENEKDGVMEVNAVVEKPALSDALSNNAIIGRYVLDGKIFSMIKTLKPRNNEIYLTDCLDELAKRGELLASTIEDYRYDVGDKAGYIKANVERALKSPEIGEEIKNYVIELAERIKA